MVEVIKYRCKSFYKTKIDIFFSVGLKLYFTVKNDIYLNNNKSTAHYAL